MPEEAVQVLSELLQEVRNVRAELSAMRHDLSMLVEDRRDEVKMQSPLVGRDLFTSAGHEGNPTP